MDVPDSLIQRLNAAPTVSPVAEITSVERTTPLRGNPDTPVDPLCPFLEKINDI